MMVRNIISLVDFIVKLFNNNNTGKLGVFGVFVKVVAGLFKSLGEGFFFFHDHAFPFFSEDLVGVFVVVCPGDQGVGLNLKRVGHGRKISDFYAGCFVFDFFFLFHLSGVIFGGFDGRERGGSGKRGFLPCLRDSIEVKGDC